MTNEELLSIVKTLAASVVAHDDRLDRHDTQIAGLLAVTGNLAVSATKHDTEIAELRRSVAETHRLLQAYLTRLPLT